MVVYKGHGEAARRSQDHAAHACRRGCRHEAVCPGERSFPEWGDRTSVARISRQADPAKAGTIALVTARSRKTCKEQLRAVHTPRSGALKPSSGAATSLTRIAQKAT